MAEEQTAQAAPGGTPETDEQGRTLNQDEIDSLLGFAGETEDEGPKTGIHALLDNALSSYERLPMLEVVFDRFVRMLSTTLRNFTSDNVDVDIHSITPLRFGDYINSIPMPALVAIFKAIEWENFGLVTFNSALTYTMVDVLFGGRRYTRPVKVEGRPYTTIEQSVVQQLTELILTDMGAAFDPLSPATFQFERMESNPRFATIARPADAAVLLQLRVSMEDRGGNVEILLPYVTLEPIKELLNQVFMGEKFGKDTLWENHLAKEIYHSKIHMEAILDKKMVHMADIVDLKVGSTIVLNKAPDDEVLVHCDGINMFSGRLGRHGDSMAISVQKVLNRRMREEISE